MEQKKGFTVQVALCLLMLGACLFSYLEKQNELTELRIYVPKLVKEIQLKQEVNVGLKYQIQKFESPEHLMLLASDSKFNHLKYPLSKEVLVLEDTPQLDWSADKKTACFSSKIRHTLAVGAK